MAQLNFPDPNTTQTYTQAGITWTWNAALGVWSSDDNDGFTETDGDTRYLRKDADAGVQTVEDTDRTIFRGPLTTGQITLPGGGGDSQAITRGEVESMILGLDPTVPGVGDITAVNAGDGLEGGGSIGNVSLGVDDSVVRTTRTITAGSGLTGGGDLSANRTINIGSGDGINVTNNAINVNNTVVRTTGDQTIGGIKTFNNAVTVGSGTADNHALRKSQIQDLIDAIPGGSGNEVYKNVKDFGAVGDGTTNDSGAIQTAINSGGCIYFPAGRYLVNSTITANSSVSLIGDGQQSIILFDGPGGTTGCFNFVVPTRKGALYKMSDITVMSKLRTGRVHAYGVKLEYTGAGTVIGGANHLELNNVHIVGEIDTDATQAYFAYGLWLLNCGGVVANNLDISSYNQNTEDNTSSAGVFVQNTKAGNAMTRAFLCTNLYVQKYHDCVKVDNAGGQNIESLYISIGELIGYRGVNNLDGQATYLSGLHMDIMAEGVQCLASGGIVRLVGCDIRGERGSGNLTNYVLKLHGSKTTVSGCNISGPLTSEGVIQIGGGADAVNGFSIVGNHIRGKDISTHRSIEVNLNVTDVTYGGNTFDGFAGTAGTVVNAVGGELIQFGQRGA